MPRLAGGLLALTLGLLLFRSGPGASPAVPAAPRTPESAPTAPDLSALSPAERFDRLYQRIIGAAQAGDQATVTRFLPMAVAAFGMLDTVTVDARYHLAMLHLHVGNLAAAAAQGDSIGAVAPGHLFGPVVAAAVARWKQDTRARDAAYRRLLQRYDAELAKDLPEYREHRAMLEELKQTATRPGS